VKWSDRVDVEIRPLAIGEDGSAFRTLNEEWITHFFVLEPKDRESLAHPEAILEGGGQIYFAYLDGAPAGCVALVRLGDGVFELSKMAVSPEFRGRGIGRTLLEYTIAQAREMGIPKLFLGSSSKLKNAVHLYESLGFRHISREDVPWEAYARADVFMEMTL
jgi:putative acetyltransferase